MNLARDVGEDAIRSPIHGLNSATSERPSAGRGANHDSALSYTLGMQGVAHFVCLPLADVASSLDKTLRNQPASSIGTG